MDAPAPPPDESTAADPPRAVRGLFAALLEALRTRLDLATVELEIHLRALLQLLIWAVGAMACAMLALAFGLTALVVALWDTHRMLALLGGSLVFVALTVLFGWLSARALRREPELLEGSLAQLHEDQRRAGGVP
jgi:uncharacterized membrane protein YqjE